ncbi:MAG TPA: phosphoribosyl-AMP cyclohydrolase [Paenalcaligenes sp.]|nr:phosphoribosyl-AMP cyclohydrolase [Paenalcaligenes sp.]
MLNKEDASMSWLTQVQFDAQGLIPAIAQDWQSGKVLMVAWMNATALEHTVQSRKATYWSRSRQKLWHKGEESGHEQIVHDIRMDCDADVILLSVEQKGGIACHTGRESCFYQQLQEGPDGPQWHAVDPVLKDPTKIYR